MHLGGQPLDTMSILVLSFPSLPLQWPSAAMLFWRDSLKGSCVCVWETTELRGNLEHIPSEDGLGCKENVKEVIRFEISSQVDSI